MPDISELLALINTAVYGKDVRGAIHDAIEECYTNVETAETLADTAAEAANEASERANDAAALAYPFSSMFVANIGGTFTQGRIDKSTGYESSTKYAFSQLFKRTGEPVYWDDTKYTVAFCYYSAITDDPTNKSRDALSSWCSSSPYVIPNHPTYAYVSAEFKRIDVSGANVDASDCYLSSKLPMCAYVDSLAESGGDGSELSPFQAISDAINIGAEKIFVKAGNYSPFSVSKRSRPLSIELWTMGQYSSGDEDVAKIVINFTGANTGIYIANCSDVRLSDVESVGSNSINNHYCFSFTNINHLELVRCCAHDNTEVSASTPPVVTANTYSGFYFNNVNGIIRDCVAYNVGQDGFNYHYFGDTQTINCVAYDCADDGISHHDACTGYILGGEFCRCGKAGVASPYYSAQIDMSGVYSHDNYQYGIYSAGNENRLPKGRINNCVFVGNTTKDIFVSGGTYVAWNNIYETKQVTNNATFTEFPVPTVTV